MKRFRWVVPVLVAVLLSLAGASEAYAQGRTYTAHALAARTSGGPGTAFEADAWRTYTVSVRVTAGSGTVNPFRVWLEGTPDNATWYPIVCTNVIKASAASATPPGSAAEFQRDIVSETAVVTSDQWSALCTTTFQRLRANWAISGTTPSETFEVLLFAK